MNNIQSTVKNLEEIVNKFQAGQIQACFEQWQDITNDKEILKIVQGVDIDFTELPFQQTPQQQLAFSSEQTKAIDEEIEKFLEKGVIEKCEHSDHEFI